MTSRSEIRDASVVRLTGCNQQMVVKFVTDVLGGVPVARCQWFDIEMKSNEFNFPLTMLERVSW